MFLCANKIHTIYYNFITIKFVLQNLNATIRYCHLA
jgi:hypothetical protein